jgi:hypothetical protein
MVQKTKDQEWKDESGRMVPLSYITPLMRQKERTAGNLLKGAKKINEDLVVFKENVKKLCDEVYQKAQEELKTQKISKGNFTFFNFDASIKVEVSISERIDFDDLTIQACKSKLDEFLSRTLDSKQEFVKELVNDAFSTAKGKLDAKKVLNLVKYRDKIKHELFQEALNLLEKSIRKPDSKTYFRIWECNENGEYNIIDLNFSSI